MTLRSISQNARERMERDRIRRYGQGRIRQLTREDWAPYRYADKHQERRERTREFLVKANSKGLFRRINIRFNGILRPIYAHCWKPKQCPYIFPFFRSLSSVAQKRAERAWILWYVVRYGWAYKNDQGMNAEEKTAKCIAGLKMLGRIPHEGKVK